MLKKNYLPQYIYENNIKLNIKHFDIKNRNILKYLLFNYDLTHFEKEYFHNGLFDQNNLKVNYDKLNEFINSLYNYELQIINLERDDLTFNKCSEWLKIKYNVIYLVFYKPNRMEYNISFKFILKPVFYLFSDESKNSKIYNSTCMYIDLIKKLNNNKKNSYFKKFNVGHKNFDYDFYEKLKNKNNSKRLYSNLEFISKPYYKVPDNYKYIQTFYKINKKSDFYIECINIAKYILDNICEQTLSIDSLGEAWYGANPLNLTLPIKRLPLIGLQGIISNELPKKVNTLINFRGNINKLKNQYIKPIFDIGFTKYVI